MHPMATINTYVCDNVCTSQSIVQPCDKSEKHIPPLLPDRKFQFRAIHAVDLWFVRRCHPSYRSCIYQFCGVDKMDNIIKIWRTADAVTFDVDSTVITEEGIDELAKFCGKGKQITELTKQAMQGDMTFQQSLSIRLGIINPSISKVNEFLNTHKPKFTNGIKELVSTLQNRDKKVFLVSGGFHCLITPIATQLNIRPENIYANRLKFYFTGEYAGFDENQPTSRSGGKGEVIRLLKEKKGFKTVVHIGDGSTDLEASPPADAFIAFGGNVVRESVKSQAQWFITNFNDLVKNL